MGNNTQADFSCTDEVSTDQPRPSSVYFIASHGSSVFYEGIVNEGNVFSVPIAGDDVDVIGIEIRGLTDTFGEGELLQAMKMSVQCGIEDSLTLLDTFGGLQLVGFGNEEEKLITIYADLTIRYTVANTGTRGLLLTGAFKTTPFVGTQPLLFTDDPILLENPGDRAVFSELLTVNLAVIGVDAGLDFELLVEGQDMVTNEKCGDEDKFSLQISA